LKIFSWKDKKNEFYVIVQTSAVFSYSQNMKLDIANICKRVNPFVTFHEFFQSCKSVYRSNTSTKKIFIVHYRKIFCTVWFLIIYTKYQNHVLLLVQNQKVPIKMFITCNSGAPCVWGWNLYNTIYSSHKHRAI
jgi:hypothetical protein